jgi:hypothetical protein
VSLTSRVSLQTIMKKGPVEGRAEPNFQVVVELRASEYTGRE